jgi:DNA repair protein RecN (Recombination protein N)
MPACYVSPNQIEMLLELFIRNFAIIDELRLQFDAGFNVLTGETGAGKSIILDAVELVLGDRADTTMIRAGCSEAYVEATFELNPVTRKGVLPLLAQEGLDNDSDSIVILAREVRSSGRSIARVNGRTVSLGLLRQISAPLIDIHGQGEHLSLLRPRSHLPLLDSYGGLTAKRAAMAEGVGELQTIQRELSQLQQDERLIAQRIDMLRFQVNEIKAANLEPGEEEKLREERVRLANAEQLMQHASEAVGLMIGLSEDDSGAIIDRLGKVERTLDQLARYDATRSSQMEELQGLAFQIGELAANLQTYLEQLEFNPGRLNYVEERLELISTLKRKYGDNVAAILSWREAAEKELRQISNSEERIAELEDQQEQFLHQLGKLAHELSQEREAAAQKLSSVVEGQLKDLRMDGARFSVEVINKPAENGVYVDSDGIDRRFAYDKTGIDRVQFLISANPGEPLKPMAKVASGGETSRLMLALKTALTEVDEAPTLIFDEIDQGIGGRVGDIAGRKLWGLAATAQHQVIVVTHLPQLAGYSDSHFHVSKHVHEGRTITAVVALDDRGRIDELAAMLGTRGEHATGGAEAILQQASASKQNSAKTS